MDFTTNRGPQPAAGQHAAPSAANKKAPKAEQNKWSIVAVVAAVVAVAILLIGVSVFVAQNNKDANNSNEASYVDTSKLQAVFLNTGQVYFGNIKTLNNKYFVVSNIYYLQTANASSDNKNSNTSVSLVKLGCELHEPLDRMVINRDQVTFWENLGDNGQVAKAVSTFEKQNPQGQKCADQSSSASTNSNTSVQNAGNAAKP